jgi:colicin import membrane protein
VSAPKKSYNPDAELSTGLKVSIGLHVAIFLAFTVRAIFFAPEPINYQAAIRVDMVGLPDKVDANQPLPPKKEEAKPEPKKAEPVKSEPEKPVAKVKEHPKAEPKPKAPKKDLEAVNLNKDKNKQKEALEKLKALSALDEIKKDVENEKEAEKKKIAGLGTSKNAGTKVKGNILSPGSDLTGLNKLQHDNYLADLDHQIKQNWFLPQWLSKKPLRAQVRLKIDEKGQVLSREIVLSSGNSSYDDLALETIDKSAPFAPPPEKFVSIVAVNGLLIGFPE